jgi:hypothetical protein
MGSRALSRAQRTNREGRACFTVQYSRIRSQRVRGPCYRPLQGTKQPLSCAVGTSIISLREQHCMHVIVHVQPSPHPIVWLSRRTEAAIAVFFWERVLTNDQCQCMYCISGLLYGYRAFKITGLGQAAAIGLASSRTPFTPQPLISTVRPSSASLSWNGGAQSVTNTFFVFQASRNVEILQYYC